MRFFYFHRYFLLSVVVSISLTGQIYAQKKDTVQTSWIYDKYTAFYNIYKHNPEYLKNEADRLKIRLSTTFQMPYFTIHPKDDAEKRILFDSRPLLYAGADIGWNIFSLGYSWGIGDRDEKNNRRFSFNTYSRFFAVTTEILWLNSLNISNLKDFMPDGNSVSPEKIALNGAYFRSRSAQLTFFPGGKKMAYGNTINPVFRQLKNAGTIIAALGYADYDFHTNIKNTYITENEWISELGVNKIQLSKYELGIGYSYNFVAGSHWILFVSDMIGISAKRYSYEMFTDHTPTEETKLGKCNYFRAGTCYYNKDYFVGAHVLYEIDELNTSRFLFNKNNLSAFVYVGYKFKIDRFNRFVSNLVPGDIP
ncbi:MAG: DUF4421 domain-containing protein [Tannerella sp.]|nr:DUF4421 domain-containing protein [Tannerella sp.]